MCVCLMNVYKLREDREKVLPFFSPCVVCVGKPVSNLSPTPFWVIIIIVALASVIMAQSKNLEVLIHLRLMKWNRFFFSFLTLLVSMTSEYFDHELSYQCHNLFPLYFHSSKLYSIKNQFSVDPGARIWKEDFGERRLCWSSNEWRGAKLRDSWNVEWFDIRLVTIVKIRSGLEDLSM